jgi:hypothetical protein
MAGKRTDYASVARDFVSLALDRIADRVADAEKLPEPVRSLGDRWQSLSAEQRHQIAGTVAEGLQTALAAVPAIIAATAAKYRSDKKSKNRDFDDDDSGDKDKKDKKHKKKKKH